MAVRTEYCAGLVRSGDPLRYLATLYAPAVRRPAMFAVHALDLALLEVATTTTDAMVGQIRLAWWRERLAELGQQAAPAQPLLAALADAGVSAAILDGFDDPSLAFIDGDRAAWSDLRGERLFVAIAELLGSAASADALAAGRAWAAVDGWRLGYLPVEHVTKALAAAPRRASAILRPLLAVLPVVRRDFDRADPGQPDGVTLSPSRQLRLAAAMLTGRL